MTCPKCKVEVPEGMQFCIECGAVLPEKSLRPPAPVSPPRPPQPSATPPAPPAARPAVPTSRPAPPPVAPKPATPVSPPAPPAARPVASSAAPASCVTPPATAKDEEDEFAMPGRGAAEVEDFERPRPTASATGGVICRFCKGPLDLNGDFCEQCGAPVEDAAPPGMVKPKSTPTLLPAAAPAAAAPPAQTAPAAGAPKAVPPAPKPAAPAPRPQPSPEALTMRRIEPLPPPPHLKTPAAPPTRAPAKPAVPAKPAAPAAGAAKAAETAGPAAPAAALEPAKKPALPLPLIAGVAVIVLGGAAAAWYFMRPRPAPQQSSPPAATSNPANVPAPSAPPTTTPAANAPATAQPRAARASKPAPVPAPAASATSPQRQQIANFQNQAREAYAKGNYAEPVDSSAIAYSKRALAVDPGDQYSKTLLENSVNGGKYQVQQAISKKDFAVAHRLADAMAQILPGRGDITGLKEDIAAAERAEEAARRPVASSQGPRFRVYHMHTEKSPADKGPSCLGVLALAGQHLSFKGETTSDGQTHSLDIACSDVREIKKNARVASKQGGFHVRTAATNINFAPEDASAGVVPALASGCAK